MVLAASRLGEIVERGAELLVWGKEEPWASRGEVRTWGCCSHHGRTREGLGSTMRQQDVRYSLLGPEGSGEPAWRGGVEPMEDQDAGWRAARHGSGCWEMAPCLMSCGRERGGWSGGEGWLAVGCDGYW